jgi:isocitrate dehydrogenase kinase/phosphatase
MGAMSDDLAARGAAILARAFDTYCSAFAEITSRAPRRFAHREWQGMQSDARERLEIYSRVLDDAIGDLTRHLAGATHSKAIWTAMKAAFTDRVGGRGDFELAETFFSSASRRIFTTVGVDPLVEFVAPTATSLLRLPGAPVYGAYAPAGETAAVLAAILEERAVEAPFDDLERDCRRAAERVEARLGGPLAAAGVEAIHVVRPLFFRNKAAYLVGRMLRGAELIPLVLALTNPDGRVVVDAALLDADDVSQVFSFTRSYFHVGVAQPFETVRFLKSILPLKPIAELYIAIGHNKHGKTELYRDLLRHLAGSDAPFVIAPGDEGMVMLVFTMPSLDIVFKIIKDRFAYPKTSSRRDVMDKYRLVFRHDRAGRLVDVQEFEHLEFERSRFSERLLAKLLAQAGESVTADGDRVAIRHLYIERRVEPLNLYLATAAEPAAAAAALEFGQAIKDLAATDVFPGDLLPKNFGVTRHGRVVFYDYDEICPLGGCRFRDLPESDDERDQGGEAWFYVGENDVFPEEFGRFLGLKGAVRAAFLEAHGDLLTPRFWLDMQRRIRAGEFPDFFPYPPARRLGHAGAG